MSALLNGLFQAGADRFTIGPRPDVIGPQPDLVVSRVDVIAPEPTIIAITTPEVVVEAPPRFAWDEKRWTRTVNGDVTEVRGPYRVFDRKSSQWRSFNGVIRQHGRTIAAYIADPPPEIRHHKHGACLQLTEPPWFRLHWQRQPKNLDGALIYLERMLDESING